MQYWTIKQLRFAHEMCFPKDFEDFMAEYIEDQALSFIYYAEFKKAGGLIPWIFSFSREELENGTGEMIDKLIGKLVDGYE